MNISVLGTEYEVFRKNYADDPYFEKNSVTAYCGIIEKKIVLCNLKTHPSFKDSTEATHTKVEKSILRHELIHAFFYESGLDSSSGRITDMGWAKNEEMVGWFAIQAPKLIAAFTAADAL